MSQRKLYYGMFFGNILTKRSIGLVLCSSIWCFLQKINDENFLLEFWFSLNQMDVRFNPLEFAW